MGGRGGARGLHRGSSGRKEAAEPLVEPIDAAGRKMLHNRLFTPGESLRQNQLARDRRPDRDPARAGSADLFGNGAA